MKRQRFLMVTCMAGLVGGCATVVSSGPEELLIQGKEGSTYRVLDSKRQVLAAGTLPATIELNTSEGFFSGAEYFVQFHSDGADDREIEVDTELSNWYLFGNLFSFLPIGWFLVDPYSGAMWTLETSLVNEP